MNPRDKAKELKGYKDSFSSRVGSIRIVFILDKPDRHIEVIRIDYRGGSYKHLKDILYK